MHQEQEHDAGPQRGQEQLHPARAGVDLAAIDGIDGPNDGGDDRDQDEHAPARRQVGPDQLGLGARPPTWKSRSPATSAASAARERDRRRGATSDSCCCGRRKVGEAAPNDCKLSIANCELRICNDQFAICNFWDDHQSQSFALLLSHQYFHARLRLPRAIGCTTVPCGSISVTPVVSTTSVLPAGKPLGRVGVGEVAALPDDAAGPVELADLVVPDGTDERVAVLEPLGCRRPDRRRKFPRPPCPRDRARRLSGRSEA